MSPKAKYLADVLTEALSLKEKKYVGYGTRCFDIENRWINKGLIKIATPHTDEEIRREDLAFRLLDNPTKEDIIDFSILGMNDDIFYNQGGHCFFVLEKYSLIIYPHGDDMGYGFIGMHDNKNEKAEGFLNWVKLNPDIDSCIAWQDR